VKYSARKRTASVLSAVGVVLIAASQFVVLGTLDVDTKLGIIPVKLYVEMYETGVNYRAEVNAMGKNVSIEDSRNFFTGMGNFQDTVGFAKGSAKYRNHTLTPYVWPGNSSADVVVETMVDSIPWWPVGMAQDCHVRVLFKSSENASYILIKKVWLELHRGDRYKVVWEKQPGDRLSAPGEERVYSTQVTLEEDLGKFSIVGKAEVEMVDRDGRTSNHIMRSYSDRPKMIDLWSISRADTVSIALTFAAFPCAVAAVILGAAAVYAAYRKKRWAWKLSAGASAAALLSPLFYIQGGSTLIKLIGYGEFFSWAPGIALPFAAAGVLAAVPYLLYRKPKRRKKK